ncbi:MAG TPA: hypothetical protein VEQ10_03450 [Vicinamibacteria bacterium]|nr:hypothetical protein [Vicinamibacteria bacterium]
MALLFDRGGALVLASGRQTLAVNLDAPSSTWCTSRCRSCWSAAAALS